MSFQALLVSLRPSGTLELLLREASQAAHQRPFQFQLPLARRQVIALELQNLELLRLGAKAKGRWEEPMRHRQLLEQSYKRNAELLQRKQQLRMRPRKGFS